MNYKQHAICLIFIGLLLSLFNNPVWAKKTNNKSSVSKTDSDQIIFYTIGSVFSPVIVLQENAEVQWTWDDNSTTNSTTPVKDYGSEKLRKNTLKVEPWSAVRRINIGFDAEDGGSPEIELVNDQLVSKVENLQLVAPYLKEWCSSHNRITSLDFSNFVNLETIECFLSQSLQTIDLTNTPKLKRACFVVNALQYLDVKDCCNLEELLVGSNKITDLILPEKAENLWYLGGRENLLLGNHTVINDLSNYPNIAHLSFWGSNQKGNLIIPKTDPTRWIGIRAYNNEYSSIDFRGAMQNTNGVALVDMHNNKLTRVEIGGCCQIRTLDLSQNLLCADTVDYVLKQLDELGNAIIPRVVDLSNNHPPTSKGMEYKAHLEAKGWDVIVDKPNSTKSLVNNKNIKIFPNPSNGKFHLQVNETPLDDLKVEIRNAIGQRLLTQKINDFDTELSVNQYSGKIFFVTLLGNEINSTIKVIVD